MLNKKILAVGILTGICAGIGYFVGTLIRNNYESSEDSYRRGQEYTKLSWLKMIPTYKKESKTNSEKKKIA